MVILHLHNAHSIFFNLLDDKPIVSGQSHRVLAGGEVPPQPNASKSFSGKFMVRVPPEVHRDLALEAVEAGVSLNRIVSAKLSR
jgi:hypothetical protein